MNRVKDWTLEKDKVFHVLEWGQDLNRGYGDDEIFIQNSIEDFSNVPEDNRGVMLYFEFRAGKNALLEDAGSNSPGLPKSLAAIKSHL